MRRIAALLLVLTVGCGVQPESEPRPLDTQAAPFQRVAELPGPTVTGTARVIVYLVRDGHLVAVVRRVPSPARPTDVVRVLVAGPSARESDAGLSNAVLPGTEAVKGTSAHGVVNVSVPTADSSASGRSDEVLGYAQVVLTLTAMSSVAGVRFERDGEQLNVPRADGSVSDGPLTRRDYTALL